MLILKSQNENQSHRSQIKNAVAYVPNLFNWSKTILVDSRFKIGGGSKFLLESDALLASYQHIGKTAEVTILPLAIMLLEQ